MKVLQVNRFFSNRGGAETVFFKTIGLLERSGHEVVTFSMRDPDNLPSPYSDYFVEQVDLRGNRRLAGNLQPARWLAASRALYSREARRKIEALIEATKPDVAHLHSIYHQLSPSIFGALRRHRIPTVLTLHDYKLVCPSSLMFANGSICERCRGGKFYHAVLQGCVHGSHLKGAFCATESYLHTALGLYKKGVDIYVAPSQFMKGQMAKFGLDAERIVHVPNPLDIEGYKPSDSHEGYFVYTGRLEPAKGVATLLRAVAASTKARSVELRVAGDGEQRAELEAFCRAEGLSNVKFLGWLPQEELASLLRRALFAVVPSQWYEVFSLATLEAQAFGKTVIAARIGGIPELVTDGDDGLLFEPGDVEGLSGKIETLLSDPDRAVEMGRRARQRAEKASDPAQQYRQLMAVYDRAMRMRGKSSSESATVEVGIPGTHLSNRHGSTAAASATAPPSGDGQDRGGASHEGRDTRGRVRHTPS